MITIRVQRKLLHTWIMLVIVRQHLVQIGQINGQSEYLSYILAGIRSFYRHGRTANSAFLLPTFRKHSLERELLFDNLLARIHFIIVMIKWTGLAPGECEFHFPGNLTSAFQEHSLL